jgi:hypothetical protein
VGQFREPPSNAAHYRITERPEISIREASQSYAPAGRSSLSTLYSSPSIVFDGLVRLK